MGGTDPPLRIFISAGELSGDMHAAKLVEALASRSASLSVTALGSVNLQAAGAEVICDTAKSASLGVIGNLLQAQSKLRLFNLATCRILKDRPHAVILVDSRFFNLNLAKVLRERGYKGAIAYYVAPVMWQAAFDERYRNIARQPEQFKGKVGLRFQLMRKHVDIALVIYPVGLELYRHFGVNHEFVGHPLCGAVKPALSRDETRALAGARGVAPLIGLMPGSRKEEVALIGREFIGAAKILAEKIPGTSFALPVAHPSLRAEILKMVEAAKARITLIEPRYRLDLINYADLMVVASGTATHECAAAGAPHIMAYKLHPALDFIYSRFTRFRLPAYAFPNIIAGRKVVPELIRSECRPSLIAGAALRLLNSPEEMEIMRAGLAEVRGKICMPDTLNRSAEFILAAVKRRLG